VNGDGHVDMADVAALMSLLAGSTSGSGSVASVPEPTTWQLAVIALAWCGLTMRSFRKPAGQLNA
jgi:PEP-CTERM motif